MPLMLIIVRGFPGSGKTEFASKLTKELGDAIHLDPSMYFRSETRNRPRTREGVALSHKWCRNRLRQAKSKYVVLSASLTRLWEANIYIRTFRDINPNGEVEVIRTKMVNENSTLVPVADMLSISERWEDAPREMIVNSMEDIKNISSYLRTVMVLDQVEEKYVRLVKFLNEKFGDDVCSETLLSIEKTRFDAYAVISKKLVDNPLRKELLSCDVVMIHDEVGVEDLRVLITFKNGKELLTPPVTLTLDNPVKGRLRALEKLRRPELLKSFIDIGYEKMLKEQK